MNWSNRSCEFCRNRAGIGRERAVFAAAVLGVALSFVADAQPAALKGVSASPGDAEATLSWTDPRDDAITGYSVRYATTEAAVSSAAVPWTAISGSDAATSTHMVQGLTNGARYYFQVRAASADGDGAPSNVATTRLAASPSAVVTINDSRLRSELVRSLGEAAQRDITQLDLATLDRFVASDEGLSDLTGMEYAVNLTRLSLSQNTISDVSALGSLESLEGLNLQNNAISDVSALGSLESLTQLNLSQNSISDVTALGSLKSLTQLSLDINVISDVSALGSLESLTRLWLPGNAISDISALASLESLIWLFLEDNSIADISALASLESLTTLHLSRNSISDVTALSSLESLNWLELEGNSISDVSALGSLESLTTLRLQDNSISDVTALGSLESLGWLDLDRNSISDISALGSLESLRVLHVSGNSISNVSTLGPFVSLYSLDLSMNAISDVSGLASVQSLEVLVLSGNSISDVSALGSLESLIALTLDGNSISDVSALGSLESLGWLDLEGNSISDVTALASLESLKQLNLSRNSISDVTALGSLESLTQLWLSGNAISDVSALGSLESLGWLDLSRNSISDVSALGSLESLRRLWLSGNSISDVSALGSLGSLAELYLDGNSISDATVLSGLPSSLGRLALGGNRIADIAPLVASGFGTVGLRGNPLSADSIERHLQALRAAGTAVVAGWPVPFFPAAADPSGRQGFVRVVNRSAVAGDVLIDAVDDAGKRFGPVRLAIGAGEAAHFNSRDLEAGNAAKGLSGGVGAPMAGHWRLALSSTLDIEVLSYLRTPDGFLTSVHDMLPRGAEGLRAAVFNPGSNSAQRSSLRLMNPGGGDEPVTVRGVDDRGHRRVALGLAAVPAGAARTVAAAALEAPSLGGLGDGAGKWRLTVDVLWPVEAASLLTSPRGHLTNLSTAPAADADGVWRMPLFPATDSDSRREGFVRVVNHSRQAGEAQVVAVDDGGARVGPVTLALKAGQTVHFNSGDFERGNAAKGLRDGVGSPTRGDWRLELTSELDIAVMSYIRTTDGFLTSMHDLAPPGVGAQTARVPIFNPGSNRQQVSLLRVMNDGDTAATVTVTGVDDAGTPSDDVRLTVPAGEARTWEAADLEAGGAALEGALGDGVGKWRLAVASDVPVAVMSLLQSPGGYLTNLSTATRQEPPASGAPSSL